uniref:Uncharacterized protein n=1 Tax=Picea glauca TaxID=3330 RepID=A0A101LUR9_PICGL|nr:hypothetical protein ABT39_MTgene2300 [Picea glauca]
MSQEPSPYLDLRPPSPGRRPILRDGPMYLHTLFQPFFDAPYVSHIADPRTRKRMPGILVAACFFRRTQSIPTW